MRNGDAMRMPRPTRLAWTLILLAGALFAQQQPALRPASPPSAAPQEEAKGQITGSVVSAKTGEILKGVAVTLRGMRPRGQGQGPPLTRDVMVGMDGRFVFSDLPAADYDVTVNKAGYGGQLFSSRPLARIRLGHDESRHDVVIRLQPAAVVTGRVIDAYGEPLPEAQVYALIRRAMPGRESHWMTAQRAQTNDLGEYRLHSLQGGKYVLAAQAPRATNPRGVGFAEFAPGFYPGAPSLDQATPLKLASGAEMNGVDFRLDLSPETTVRGIVLDSSTGEPCDDCNLRIGSENVMGFDDFGTRPTKDGIFVIHGLRAGAHSIIVHASGGGQPRFFVEQVQVPQFGDVEVKLLVGGSQTVSGEFILEDPPEQQQPPAAQGPQPGAQVQNATPGQQRPFMFALESLGSFPFPGGRGNVPPQGGAFELTDVPAGDYKIRLYGPAGYLRSVTLDGREIGGPRITVPRDGPLFGLKLHIAFDGATISGVVKPASGEETEGLRGEQVATAVPDPGSNPYANRAVARVELDGAFTLRGVVPGSYTLFVLPGLTIDVEDPDVRRALKPYGKQITVTRNEQVRVELTATPDSVELW